MRTNGTSASDIKLGLKAREDSKLRYDNAVLSEMR